MSERNGYEPGVPCWVDTWQPDADEAARFYARLFGWETEGPDGGPFTCTLRGRSVAAIGERSGGHSRLPVAWRAFYGAVFGWQTDTFGTGEDAMTMWRVPGYVGGEPEQPVSREVVAGMAEMTAQFPDQAAPHWRIDFWVDDVDTCVATTIERGGRAVVPAYDTPISRQAVLADPQGAVFSVGEVPS